MIYLIILSFITFLLAYAVKLLTVYVLIKIFNRAKSFWQILKPVLLYEAAAFVFLAIKPVSLIYFLRPLIPRILFPIYFLASLYLLFLIFKFIMTRKFSLLNFKKSLIIFLLMFLIITPAISFSQSIAELKIAEKLPISLADQYTIEAMMLQIYFPAARPPSQIIYEKVRRLNDIFLEEELLRELRNFIMTI